jgi:Na+/melibiose symporter-like transporter
MLAILIVSYAYGLIATLVARGSARGPLARRRSTLLALAFGTRDLIWGALYSLALLVILFGVTERSVSDPERNEGEGSKRDECRDDEPSGGVLIAHGGSAAQGT